MMNNTTVVKGDRLASGGNVISWLFGIIVLAMGIINTFWGNDALFGIFLVSLSLIYFLPVDEILSKGIGFSIPKMGVMKIILCILIIWTVIGVGELFDKIELMMIDLK